MTTPDLHALRARAERIREYADTYGDRMVVTAADMLTILDRLDADAERLRTLADELDGYVDSTDDHVTADDLTGALVRLQQIARGTESRARRDAHLAQLMDDA